MGGTAPGPRITSAAGTPWLDRSAERFGIGHDVAVKLIFCPGQIRPHGGWRLASARYY